MLLSAGCGRSISKADLASVEGTIKSFEEKQSMGEPYLEFYLQERSERFRVPVERYSRSFDRSKFFAIIHNGSSVKIQVEKEELEHPTIPPKDPEPTVYVYEMQSGDNVFLQYPAQ